MRNKNKFSLSLPSKNSKLTIQIGNFGVIELGNDGSIHISGNNQLSCNNESLSTYVFNDLNNVLSNFPSFTYQFNSCGDPYLTGKLTTIKGTSFQVQIDLPFNYPQSSPIAKISNRGKRQIRRCPSQFTFEGNWNASSRTLSEFITNFINHINKIEIM